MMWPYSLRTFRSHRDRVGPVGDIQQLDGLNLQRTRKAIYLNGEIDGVHRGRGDTVLHDDLASGGPRCVASRAEWLV
jgi:hypothetical protein